MPTAWGFLFVANQHLRGCIIRQKVTCHIQLCTVSTRKCHCPSLHPPYVIVKPQPPGNHRSIGCSMVQPHPKCPCAAALHAFDPQIQSKWLLWIAHTGLYICHVLHPRSLRCRAIIISALQAFRRRRSKVKGSEGATGRRFGAFDAKS